uniref:Uncharacterized protein n=1 Tax=Timema tahoe TaxID=61484 RepID=A0A7R9IPP5_9NEOP|nr:unnamed protein product [Timema tahoe]
MPSAVTDGSENMKCGVGQAVERGVGAAIKQKLQIKMNRGSVDEGASPQEEDKARMLFGLRHMVPELFLRESPKHGSLTCPTRQSKSGKSGEHDGRQLCNEVPKETLIKAPPSMESGKPTSSPPERDSNLDLLILGSLAQHETRALANYATETHDWTGRKSFKRLLLLLTLGTHSIMALTQLPDGGEGVGRILGDGPHPTPSKLNEVIELPPSQRNPLQRCCSDSPGMQRRAVVADGKWREDCDGKRLLCTGFEDAQLCLYRIDKSV